MHGSVLGFFAYGALQTREVEGKRVLEVGSLDVNGSVRRLIESRSPASYTGIDIVDGPGVDLVLDAVNIIEYFGAESFDVIVCAEMLEHAENWQLVFENFVWALRPGGVLVITTRSEGFAYHHPPDRWRYSQRAMRQIMWWLALDLIVLMDDPEYPGVFVKAHKPLEWEGIEAFKPIDGVTPVIEPLKFLGLPMQPDGTGYYRYWQPWNELAKSSGHLAIVPPMDNHVYTPTEDDVSEFDLVSRQRPGGKFGTMEWKRWHGFTKLVYETDDDILHPDSSLPHLMDEERIASIITCLELADAVTCSTEVLADVLRDHNDDVYVIPNYVHEDVISIEPVHRDKLTVMWTGGITHLQDLVSIQWPMNRLLRNVPHVDFHFLGVDYGPLFTECATRFTPWQTNIWDYYRAIDADIGLIPLVPTKFNQSRTHIKALEFAALGIPVVASDVDVYRQFVINGETGFLVSTPSEWMDAVFTLGSDAELRSKMGANARELARQHTIQLNWHRWSDAFERIAGRTS